MKRIHVVEKNYFGTCIKAEAYESEYEPTDDEVTDDDMALPDLIPKLEPDSSDEDLPELIDPETSSYADVKNEVKSDEDDIENRIKTEPVEQNTEDDESFYSDEEYKENYKEFKEFLTDPAYFLKPRRREQYERLKSNLIITLDKKPG